MKITQHPLLQLEHSLTYAHIPVNQSIMSGVPIIDTLSAALFGKFAGEIYQSPSTVTLVYYAALILQYLFGLVPGNVIDITIFVYQPIIVWLSALIGDMLTEKTLNIIYFVDLSDFSMSAFSFLSMFLGVGAIAVYQALLNVNIYLATGIAFVVLLARSIISVLALRRMSGEGRGYQPGSAEFERSIILDKSDATWFEFYSMVGFAILCLSQLFNLIPNLGAPFVDYAHVIPTSIGVLVMAVWVFILFIAYRKPWRNFSATIMSLFATSQARAKEV